MKLKELRESVNMTQKEFAGKFNIPLSTYFHWEQGMRTPPIYVVTMIETILDLEEQVKEK